MCVYLYKRHTYLTDFFKHLNICYLNYSLSFFFCIGKYDNYFFCKYPKWEDYSLYS